jgi:hypothetical protein
LKEDSMSSTGKKVRWLLATLAACVLGSGGEASDWPTIHHDLKRTGFTEDCVRPPYSLDWVRSFPNEILTSRIEPIVAEGKVFVGTYSGNLYALDRRTGEIVWEFATPGPIVHSPAYHKGIVYVGSIGGTVHALAAGTGDPVWTFTTEGRGGFSASPAVTDAAVLIGSRDGNFYALDVKTGDPLWYKQTGGPIRNTAAVVENRVIAASDTMHCYAYKADSGDVLWRSPQLYGQSFRDYYPVVAGNLVVLRSLPTCESNDDLNGGTGFLAKSAGVDPSDWRNIDRFHKSDRTVGTPELIRQEQEAIVDRLQRPRDRQTCFVLDLGSGKPVFVPPVLYGAGNGGTGIPPTLTRDGKIVIFYRTMYSNWNHGVKPCVGLGFMGQTTGFIEPIRHASGNIPPWNTFWGTCDETTVFAVGGDLLYCTHMGTICALDLKTLKLFHVFGNRDTWGGYPRIPWMRNEWHGPARGCAAISDDQLFWATGSRVIAIRGGRKAGEGPQPDPKAQESTQGAQQKESGAAAAAESLAKEDFGKYIWQVSSVSGAEGAAVSALRAELDKAVRELVNEGPFAPLYVNFGIGGRDLFFTSPADDIEALAAAYPYLREETRAEARRYVDRLLRNRDLFGESALYGSKTGPRREYHPVPLSDQPGYWEAGPKRSAFGGCYALWRWSEVTGDRSLLERFWQPMRSAFSEARPVLAKLNLERGERYGNLYINALIGFARAARVLGHETDTQAAAKMAEDQLRRLIEAARKGAEKPEESIFCPIRSHYQCMGRFGYLSPEIGRAYAENAGGALKEYISFIDLTMPGWFIVNNEHQIHFGENYTDGPDLAEAIFSLRAYTGFADAKLLDQWIDIPWCKGDLYTIKKLVLGIEFAGKRMWRDFSAGGTPTGK